MANEISYSGKLTFSSSGQVTSVENSVSVTPAEVETISGIQAAGTVDEAMVLGDLAAPGWVFLKNLNDTNYVEVGANGSDYEIKLLAGASAGPMLWNAAAIHLKANTGACNVAYVITGR